ncbi:MULTISPECIES: ATP-binding protein [Acinetobacter]|uniref:ATP-binding protein n=1 Tax=Acinetobacter TaxID=469 RepID=UPI00044A6BBB|nr:MULTISPECIES: ATP-binding protein [Acinetobacter]EXR34316.1 his Kinase A domain protein [Acinetobacter sp. 1179249]MBJ8463123.1 GHKL domain-containing protein [Acinetobacter nosocomialis]MBP1486114.1 GHKL domain-containing protein [Acinetobacter nosocomialis]MBP1497106.1 GHKL domain-containing protein [Acinetobacter nosocomialis]MBR7689641.1 GHKL domain-containing protein [Acinetobacter nosocomialis]
MKTNRSSLQSQLVKTTMWSSIVVGLLALSLLTIFSIYHNMSVQDEIMDEISDTLLVSDLSKHSMRQFDELSDEFDIQYELLNSGQLLTHSHTYQHELFEQGNLSNGFSYFWFDGQLWRSLAAQQKDSELQVEVFQPMSTRVEEVLKALAGYSGLMVLFWLLQWVIVSWRTEQQLAALNLLSKRIAQKTASNLEPIQDPDVITEIQPVIDALNQLLARLQRALVAEQRFTADASHELRSPLSAIQMRLQVLQRKYQHIPELDQDFERIQEDVSRSTKILENLLLLARLEPNEIEQPELFKSVIDLNHLLARVIETVSMDAQAKQMMIETNILSNETKIFANEELLFIAFRNLFDNAIRYSPTLGFIYVELSHYQQQLKISIEDTGNGVDDEVLRRLGQRFFRVLGTQQQGSGLGISITKKIIQLHGGELQFMHANQGGLKVEVTLLFNHEIQK